MKRLLLFWFALIVATTPVLLPAQAKGTLTKPSLAKTLTPLWVGNFKSADWQTHWGVRPDTWGMQNTQVMPDPQFGKVLRVTYVAGSASPTVTRSEGTPVGGAQFYATLGLPNHDALRLSYYVRFSQDFDFVKGGKLPGLFGGTVNNGRHIPDGTDGLSTRFMWRREGDGEVYAYLPTSQEHGTSLGRGNWRFQPGVWYHLEQEVTLNQPGQSDGRIRVWVNGTPALDQQGLTFRTVSDLKIEGLFFSTFFGGSDSTWATPKQVYSDFANFAVFAVPKDQTVPPYRIRS